LILFALCVGSALLNLLQGKCLYPLLWVLFGKSGVMVFKKLLPRWLGGVLKSQTLPLSRHGI